MRAQPFVFLRHGQTDWNLQGRIQGHTDIPLNATGRAQAAAAAARLTDAGITRAITSPLSRARETAEIVAAHLRIPIEEDADLRERAFGSFEGRLRAEVRREHGIPPTQPISTIMPPDSEQWLQTLARVRTSINRWLAAHPGEALLFVSHNGVFCALHEALMGINPDDSSNATPYCFSLAGERWRMDECGVAAGAEAVLRAAQ